MTLPLSKSLDSQDFNKHKAMVAVELEVLAKKYDRFGWDRDRGTMAHDRLITDWQDALGDYTLDEIKRACVNAVLEQPNKMPNEGHIRAIIIKGRQRDVVLQPTQPEPERIPATAEQRQAIMNEVNFSGDVKVRKFTDKPEERE